MPRVSASGARGTDEHDNAPPGARRDDGRIGSFRGVQTIERDGIRLAYTEAGSADPPVVLLHGMACRHDHMLPVMRHLEAHHRCVAFDLRGHGASDAPRDAYAMDDFIADLGRAVDELDLRRPILIGHSFGGSIALAYADRYPERVRALVLLDSGMRSNQVTMPFGGRRQQ